MDFSYYKKDEKGNRIKKGVQSNIICVPPTDTAFEGWMLNKWVCDEGGKIPNLYLICRRCGAIQRTV
jgi:hypothetical protein